MDFEIGTENIFADLDLPLAPLHLAKVRLVQEIERFVETKGWTQKQAAEAMGLDQPKVSKLFRGSLERFTLDRIYKLVDALGIEVEIKILTKSRR